MPVFNDGSALGVRRQSPWPVLTGTSLLACGLGLAGWAWASPAMIPIGPYGVTGPRFSGTLVYIHHSHAAPHSELTFGTDSVSYRPLSPDDMLVYRPAGTPPVSRLFAWTGEPPQMTPAPGSRWERRWWRLGPFTLLPLRPSGETPQLPCDGQ